MAAGSQAVGAIRFEVDHRGELGQFVLTGSAVPAGHKGNHPFGYGAFHMAYHAAYEFV